MSFNLTPFPLLAELALQAAVMEITSPTANVPSSASVNSHAELELNL
jgi:hypothetical protein